MVAHEMAATLGDTFLTHAVHFYHAAEKLKRSRIYSG